MGAWQVYMVRCVDGSYYTGITTDLPRRLLAHNEGRGAKYTRGRGPVELCYREPAESRAAALKREAAIKRLPLAAKRRLAAGRSELLSELGLK